MSNRFTDTEKWKDPWYCGLSPSYKLFWNFLCDNCNIAGIWNVNWPLVKFHCWEESFDVKSFGDRIVVINEEKWFIKKFVLYQQKVDRLEELNPLNKCHASIINILNKEGILSPCQAPAKGLPRGYSNSIVKVNTTSYINKIGPFEPPPPEMQDEIDKIIGRKKK